MSGASGSGAGTAGATTGVMRLTQASPRLRVNPTLILSNLPPSAEEDKLREVLSAFGTIASLRIIRRDSGLCSGSAEVSFTSDAESSDTDAAETETETSGGQAVLDAAENGALVYADDDGETALTARSLINTSSLLLASQLLS